jgi:hypothetical protein
MSKLQVWHKRMGVIIIYYHAIPRSDMYKDLFCSVIFIIKTFRQKGYMWDNIPENKIKTNFSSSKQILQTSVNLTCDGVAPSIFNFIIELEFNKALNSIVTEEELCELTLTKELIKYIRENVPDSIYELLCYVCSSQVRDELVPTVNWVDTPI